MPRGYYQHRKEHAINARKGRRKRKRVNAYFSSALHRSERQSRMDDELEESRAGGWGG